MGRRTIGSEFRTARERRGLSQRAVAIMAGVSQTAARNLEADAVGAVEVRVARPLLAVVGMTLADLDALLPPVRLAPPPPGRGRPRKTPEIPGKTEEKKLSRK